MTTRLFTTLIVLFFSTGCATHPVRPEPTVAMGDSSGYARMVSIRHKDLKSVCSFEKFQEGFRYTYMSMWNGRVDKVLVSKPSSDVATYYKGKIFYSKPNKKAILDANPRERNGYNECQESSYQQGKMNGFLYSLDDLKVLQESAPK